MPVDPEAFAAWDGDTLVVNVIGKPGAPRNAIGRVQGQRLRVSVTAAPEAGKATDQMVRFMAKSFGVPASSVTVVFGATSPSKRLRIKAPTVLPAGIDWPERRG